jgi:hypothetical protein
MQALPLTVNGGSIDDLRKFLNVVSDDNFRLVIAWLVGALRERGPFPILVLSGEHGTAKTTVARILRECVDPNRAPVRAARDA